MPCMKPFESKTRTYHGRVRAGRCTAMRLSGARPGRFGRRRVSPSRRQPSILPSWTWKAAYVPKNIWIIRRLRSVGQQPGTKSIRILVDKSLANCLSTARQPLVIWLVGFSIRFKLDFRCSCLQRIVSKVFLFRERQECRLFSGCTHPPPSYRDPSGSMAMFELIFVPKIVDEKYSSFFGARRS